jgi:hypothetical protein
LAREAGVNDIDRGAASDRLRAADAAADQQQDWQDDRQSAADAAADQQQDWEDDGNFGGDDSDFA